MNAEIYRKCVRYAKDAPDGETPTLIICTEEANGYAAWRSSYEDAIRLIVWSSNRDEVLERGVTEALKEIQKAKRQTMERHDAEKKRPA